jgi:hypothetical protein
LEHKQKSLNDFQSGIWLTEIDVNLAININTGTPLPFAVNWTAI